jgi:hypothetical protein
MIILTSLMRFYGITKMSDCQIHLTFVRDLSGKEFNNNDSKGPKSVAAFIVKLSELAPRLVLKQMTLLVKLLDSEVSNPFLKVV